MKNKKGHTSHEKYKLVKGGGLSKKNVSNMSVYLNHYWFELQLCKLDTSNKFSFLLPPQWILSWKL